MVFLRQRLPESSDVLQVFGTVVFVVHSWSVRGFLYEFPSFLLDFHAGEIFAIFSYMMAMALIESLGVLAGLLLLSLVLPSTWFRDGFSYKSFLTILIASAAAIWLQSTLRNSVPEPQELAILAAICTVTLVVLIYTANRIDLFRRILSTLVDRLSIMTFLYVPLGVIGFVAVIWRLLQ